ncbi:hypothetical protein K9M16_02095 [Candidatus Babeliales bacterium]|nr:hypothetical protein [Candidatus Babeliales bacterium]
MKINFKIFFATLFMLSVININAQKIQITGEPLNLSAKNVETKDQPFAVKIDKNSIIRHLKNAIRNKLSKMGIKGGDIEIVPTNINRPLKDTDKVTETAIIGDNVVLFKIKNQMMKESPLRPETATRQMELETLSSKETLIKNKILNFENRLKKLQEEFYKFRKTIEETK